MATWMFEEGGSHPEDYTHYECQFAARHIQRLKPERILDIGSYRHFVIGLLARQPVTTVDVRPRRPVLANEVVVTCDAKALRLPDDTFDIVTSLCSLEHFGLSRYGDAFDPDADLRAMAEQIRVLKPGGRLVFSTTITRARPTIVFNAHRIYSYDMLHAMCDGLRCEEEAFYSIRLGRMCTLDEVTNDAGRPGDPPAFDIYLGCWQKPAHTTYDRRALV